MMYEFAVRFFVGVFFGALASFLTRVFFPTMTSTEIIVTLLLGAALLPLGVWVAQKVVDRD